MFYADRAEGCIQATLNAGNTLLIPSSWPHAVVTQEDAIVVGGNFLHAFELRCAIPCGGPHVISGTGSANLPSHVPYISLSHGMSQKENYSYEDCRIAPLL